MKTAVRISKINEIRETTSAEKVSIDEELLTTN